MPTTIRVTTEISPKRELHVTLPEDTPIGPAEVTIVISPASAPSASTFGELLNSEFFGMWHDREDITDSETFARKLRTEAWSRTR